MGTNSFSNVADLSAEQRHAVESMVGHPLDAQDAVFLVVMRPGHEPTAGDKSRARARLQAVFQQVDRHGEAHPVPPDSADDAIDQAVQDIRSRTA